MVSLSPHLGTDILRYNLGELKKNGIPTPINLIKIHV